MIEIRNFFTGIMVCALVMVPSYMVLWFLDMGGIYGVMYDDSYPMSVLFLPVIATIFSGIAFCLGVYPSARLAIWISNRQRLTIGTGGFIAVYTSATIGVLFGADSGGLRGALTYGAFLGVPSLVFWLTTAKRHVEQDRGVNR